MRNMYCMVHMGHFAENSGALAMPFFLARWSNLTVLREICAPQTHPMGFVKSTHPTRGVRVRRTHPSRIPEDILLDRVQGTKYETGKLVQPGFLIREWMRSTLILYNDSWISSFPVSLRPPFSLLIFSIVVSILLFC